MSPSPVLARAAALALVLTSSACGGGGGGGNPPPAAATHAVGGAVSGLAGAGLVLRNNGGDDLAISANGPFTFATKLAGGAEYAVTVLTQPSGPTQTCTPAGATGVVGAAAVTSVVVTCTTAAPSGTGEVGPAGGTVEGHYGARLTVPAGALAGTLTLGIARDSTGAPAFAPEEVAAVGAPYALTPHGTTFSSPATVRVPFDPALVSPGETPVLYKAEEGGSFAPLPTTVDGSFLVASLSSFSWVLPAAAKTAPRNVYAVLGSGALTPGEVVSLPLDRTTGALGAATSHALAGQAPLSLTVHPSGRWLYVTHGGSTKVNGIDPGSVAVYPLSSVNGRITGPAIASVATGAGPDPHEPVLPVVHPSGKWLYLVNHGRFSAAPSGVTVMAIDPATGGLSAATAVASGAGAPATGLAFDRLGTRAYVSYVWTPNTPTGNTFHDTVKVYAVDPATGLFSANPIGGAATGSNPWSVAVDVNSKFLFVADLSEHDVRRYAIGAGGALTYLGSTATLNQPGSLAVDPFGRYLYAGKQTPYYNVNVLSFAVNASGGLDAAGSALTGCPGGGCVGPISVVADPQGQFVYGLDPNGALSSFSVGQATGTLTATGSLPDVFRPGTAGVGVPFKFAVSGTSPVWQPGCTTGCGLVGVVVWSSSGGSGGGGGNTGSMTNPTPPTGHRLTVTQGPWMGVVRSTPAGIDYGPPTQGNQFSAEFPAGSTVQLCATEPAQPAGAYDITWEGDCSGTSFCTSVTLARDRDCHVEFTPAGFR